MPSENEYNIPEMLSDVSSGLFGGESNSPTPDPAVPPAVPPQSEPASPAPAAPQLKALPKSWKKEMEAHWGKLPPEVHDYIYQREGDVLRGIQQYKQGHDTWQTVFKPFEPIWQQYPDVNPAQVLSALMQNHLTLVMGSPEEKRAIAQRLIQEYNLGEFLGQPQAQQPQVPPEVLNRINSIEQRFYRQGVAEQQKLVDTFAADPKNKYFSEVADDILRLIQAGAPDLATAYEQACWLNPAVREKLIADKQNEQAAANQKRQAAAALNVSDSPTASVSDKNVGSMDDTINSIVRKHFSH